MFEVASVSETAVNRAEMTATMYQAPRVKKNTHIFPRFNVSRVFFPRFNQKSPDLAKYINAC